jgi:hypothetical protein
MNNVSGVLAIVSGVAMMVQPRRAIRWGRRYHSFMRKVVPFLYPGWTGQVTDDDPYWFLPPIVFGAFFVFIGIGMLFFSNQ